MTIEKLKLSRELNTLVAQVKTGELTGLNTVRVPRRINAIVALLGGSNATPVAADDTPAPTPADDGLSDRTTDENYRWKDTAHIAGARKHMSATFSEAKKQGRNLNTNDIDWDEVSSDMRLAQSLITKENVFGVVDWKALKEAGMPSEVAYLIKRLYTAVDKEPVDPTNPQSLRNYVAGISELRDQLEACRSYDDIRVAVIGISKKLIKPKYLKAYYADPSFANNYAPAGIYEVRCMSELGERFYSWIFKSGNKGLHECKTKRDPSTRKESKGANWEWAKLEPVVKDEQGKEVKPRKKSFQLEHATDIQRIGGKQVDLKSSKELEEMFGFKGIQSGNWVLKDKSSAEFHMKATAEAMLDMSDVLGIDAKHLGLNGNLAMAFGARGKGGALAHYESSTKVINITKMRGGGSLGHEYFHAIDNLVNDLMQGEAGSIRFFATRDHAQIPDKELSAAFKKLNEALLIRKDSFVFKSQYYDFNEQPSARQMEFIEQNAYDFPSRIGKTLYEANQMPLDEIVGQFEQWATKFQQENMRSNVRNLSERFLADYLTYRHYKQGDVPIRSDGAMQLNVKGSSSRSLYATNATQLDDGKADAYWSKEYEMAARAFSAYLQDRLEEQGRRNDYLAYSTKGGNGRVGEIAYPQGVEREEINKAFDELFKVIKSKEILKNASENKQLLDSIFGDTSYFNYLVFDEIEEEVDSILVPENDATPEVMQLVDAMAQSAATSVVNEGENPTQEQLIANDYKTASVSIAGMNISIENPVNSVRRGVDSQGNEWETVMSAHYGYFDGTLGADGDELDVFVAEGTPHDFAGDVFVIGQLDEKGNFDEHKVVLGVQSGNEAQQLYRAHYDENFNGIGYLHSFSLEDFKNRVYTGRTALLDSIRPMMLDSWAQDGRFDLIPFKKLDQSKLDQDMNEAKANIKEPIVVFADKGKFYVIHGRNRLKIAENSSEGFVPAILIHADEGYTLSDVKAAMRKCGNVVHAEALAALIIDQASQRLEAAL